MSDFPPCPQCKSTYTYQMDELFVCPDCAHEWPAQAAALADDDQGPRVIKDAHGNPLAEGDSVLLGKDV